MKMRTLGLVLFVFFTCCSKSNLKGNGMIGPINNGGEEVRFSKEKGESMKVPQGLAAYYNSVDFSKGGKELYEELAVLTIAKHKRILDYSQRHKYLQKADADLKDKSKVILVYTGEKGKVSEIRGGAVINTEHTYPKSLLNASAKGYTVGDLHHLRYCSSRVNSQRSNRPFTKEAGACRAVGKYWYPGDEWIGDVARMIMYLNLRYNEEFNKISTGGLDLLLEWNAKDPVSAFERQRNEEIENVQGNRNPFIDNPYLATKIWGGKMKAENEWK